MDPPLPIDHRPKITAQLESHRRIRSCSGATLCLPHRPTFVSVSLCWNKLGLQNHLGLRRIGQSAPGSTYLHTDRGRDVDWCGCCARHALISIRANASFPYPVPSTRSQPTHLVREGIQWDLSRPLFPADACALYWLLLCHSSWTAAPRPVATTLRLGSVLGFLPFLNAVTLYLYGYLIAKCQRPGFGKLVD